MICLAFVLFGVWSGQAWRARWSCPGQHSSEVCYGYGNRDLEISGICRVRPVPYPSCHASGGCPLGEAPVTQVSTGWKQPPFSEWKSVDLLQRKKDNPKKLGATPKLGLHNSSKDENRRVVGAATSQEKIQGRGMSGAWANALNSLGHPLIRIGTVASC